MGIGYIALGILSILYYAFIVWYTKKWNSTFSLFWVAFCLLCICLSWVIKVIPDWGDYIMLGVTIAIAIIFLVIEILILCAMVAIAPKKLDYIIILGAQVKGKHITNSLKRRLDRGIRYLRDNPDTICIVSGGKGRGEEISEAGAMAEYLVDHGIEGMRISIEDKSKTTCENLAFSYDYIQNVEKDKVGIVSNNFHIYRAIKMARLLGYKKVFAIPASTDLVVFPNYMVREFFAFFKIKYEVQNMNKE